MAKNSDGVIRFYTGGDSSSNERMRITSDGYVGIGVTAPAQKLDVDGMIKMKSYTSALIPNCVASIVGTITYSSTDHHFYGCVYTGSIYTWKQLDN